MRYTVGRQKRGEYFCSIKTHNVLILCQNRKKVLGSCLKYFLPVIKLCGCKLNRYDKVFLTGIVLNTK